jgi:hypothetical protein
VTNGFNRVAEGFDLHQDLMSPNLLLLQVLVDLLPPDSRGIGTFDRSFRQVALKRGAQDYNVVAAGLTTYSEAGCRCQARTAASRRESTMGGFRQILL